MRKRKGGERLTTGKKKSTARTPRDSKGKPEYELSDEDREWVARIVDSLGPLTREDREFLGLILRKHH
jgi:hypothetical protein